MGFKLNPITGKLDLVSDTSSFVAGSGSAGQVAFWLSASALSGDNSLYWDDTNKRLGIGTTSPGYKLEVNSGSSALTGMFKSDVHARLYIWADADGGTTADPAILLGTGANPDQSWYFISDTSDSDKLKIGTRADGWGNVGDGDLITIQTNGNIGIGTSTPDTYLTIPVSIGEGFNAGKMFIGTWNSGSTYGVICNRNFRLVDSNTGYALVQDDNGHTYINSAPGYPISFAIGGTGKMVLTSVGLGIGTTSPIRRLTVDAGSDDIIANFYSTGTYPELQIAATGTQTGRHPLLSFRDGTTQVGVIGVDIDADLLTIGRTSVNNDYIVIDNSGRVGIGTTSPVEKLDIASDDDQIAFSPSVGARFRFFNYSNLMKMYFNTSSSCEIKLGNDDTGDLVVTLEGIVNRTEQPAVRVTLSADQTIPDNATTKLQLATESYDTQNEFDTTTYTYTATEAGDYDVKVSLRWISPTDQARYWVAIVKNGATYSASYDTASGVETFNQNFADVVNLAAGDTLYINVWHNSGTSKIIDSGALKTFVTITKIN